MKCKPGKLYKCLDHFLMIYLSKEMALRAMRCSEPSTSGADAASAVAAYWSKELNQQVRYSKPGEVFMFLKKDGDFCHVLFGDKQGWIINRDWLKFVGITVV